MNKKVTLFLLGKKGLKCIEILEDIKYRNIIGKIIVGRDKNIYDDYADEIIKHAKQHNISLHERSEEFAMDEFSVAIGWRWIIDETKTKLLVFHDSLLPKYRGFSPLVNCLINGEEKIGASVIWGAKEYDTGNLVLQDSINIQYPLKIDKAIDLLAELYGKLLLEILSILLNTNEIPKGESQKKNIATYSLWRDEEDYFIDWNKTSKQISRFIDAVGYPFKGAKSYLDKNIIIIQDATPINDVNIENRDVGKIIFNKGDCPAVVCREGLLKINLMVDNESNNLLPLDKFRSRFR